MRFASINSEDLYSSFRGRLMDAHQTPQPGAKRQAIRLAFVTAGCGPVTLTRRRCEKGENFPGSAFIDRMPLYEPRTGGTTVESASLKVNRVTAYALMVAASGD